MAVEGVDLAAWQVQWKGVGLARRVGWLALSRHPVDERAGRRNGQRPRQALDASPPVGPK